MKYINEMINSFLMFITTLRYRLIPIYYMEDKYFSSYGCVEPYKEVACYLDPRNNELYDFHYDSQGGYYTKLKCNYSAIKKYIIKSKDILTLNKPKEEIKWER